MEPLTFKNHFEIREKTYKTASQLEGRIVGELEKWKGRGEGEGIKN